MLSCLFYFYLTSLFSLLYSLFFVSINRNISYLFSFVLATKFYFLLALVVLSTLLLNFLSVLVFNLFLALIALSAIMFDSLLAFLFISDYFTKYIRNLKSLLDYLGFFIYMKLTRILIYYMGLLSSHKAQS